MDLTKFNELMTGWDSWNWVYVAAIAAVVVIYNRIKFRDE